MGVEEPWDTALNEVRPDGTQDLSSLVGTPMNQQQNVFSPHLAPGHSSGGRWLRAAVRQWNTCETERMPGGCAPRARHAGAMPGEG